MRLLHNVLIAVLVAWTRSLFAESESSSTTQPPKIKVSGEITHVDSSARYVEVKVDGKTERLTLTENCHVKIKGEQKTLADLKTGDKCHCICREQGNGRLSVSRIIVPKDSATGKTN